MTKTAVLHQQTLIFIKIVGKFIIQGMIIANAAISTLHGPLLLPGEAKFTVCSINNPALSLLMKYLVIGQR